MIANIKSLEKYCTDYQNIQNYAEAVKSPLKYDLHHRREISENKSKKQLIAENLYYGRPPEELIFLEHGEHIRLHKEGKNLSAETKQKMSDALKGKQNALGHHWNPSAESRQKMSDAHKGKNLSAETRKKMSAAHKGKQNALGHHWNLSAETRKKMSNAKKNMSAETRKRMSEAMKGKHWHLENGRRVWTE